MSEPGLEHKWDLVDAVSRSPLLTSPQVAGGVELAEVEKALLSADGISAAERERLIAAVRELAEIYVRLSLAN